ncbi:hypothetical protein DL98DRAFT_592998 [Cadophora sp. DSE1049]|nr:hypothetical protein DL98DRAFT_592998 [Cadophora sp. DSE1049]
MLSSRLLMLSSGGERQQLKEVIMMLGHLDATESRDFLYSILGLIDFGDTVVPNYEISPRDALCFAVGKVLTESGDIGLLELAGSYSRRPVHKGIQRKVDGLPTWMPDLVTVRKMRTGDHYYNAGAVGPSSRQQLGLGPIVYVSERPSEISISGTILDTIESISPWSNALPLQTEAVTEVYPRNFLSCLPPDHNSDYFDGASRLRAYWRTLMFDQNSAEKRRLAREDLEAYESFFTSFLKIEGAGEGGYMAMVPDGTEVGDIVALLYQGEVPFIFKPVPTVSDNNALVMRMLYELIGPAYVHGFMDGLAMEWLAIEKLEGTVFTLI